MSKLLHGRSALLISECQRGIITPGMGGFQGLIDQVEARSIVPRTAVLIQSFRHVNLPVFHLTVAHRPNFADVQTNSLLAAIARKQRLVVAGTTQAEIVPQLIPHDTDIVVERSSGLIGFCGTSLDAMLRRMNIQTVVLAGVSTNVAIAGCAMVAADAGYHAIVAEDCTAAADRQTHTVIVENQLRMVARIASAGDIAAAVQKRG